MNNISKTPKSSKALSPKFVTDLAQLSACAKQVIEYGKDIHSYGLFIDEKQSLEDKLNAATLKVIAKEQELESVRNAMEQELFTLRTNKDNTIEKLQSENLVLMTCFEARVQVLKCEAETKERLQSQLVALQTTLDEANTTIEARDSVIADRDLKVEKTNKLLKETHATLDETKAKLRSKERELIGTVSEFENCRLKLEKASDLIEWKDVDIKSQRKKFQGLASECYQIAKAFFLIKFPKEYSADVLLQKLQETGFTKDILPNIPMSDSLPSQYLRMAAAQKVITDQLYLEVFKPYYLPEANWARQVLEDIGTKLDRRNQVRGSLFRHSILCAHKADEEMQIKKLIRVVSETVRTKLRPLLSDPQSRQDFQARLEDMIKKAVELWKPIQRSNYTSHVNIDCDKNWQRYRDYDAGVKLTLDQEDHIPARSDPILSLFPQVGIGSGEIILPGYALWSDQNAVVAANLEYHSTGEQLQRATRRPVDVEKRRLGVLQLSSGDTRTAMTLQSAKMPFSDRVEKRNLTGYGSLSNSAGEESILSDRQ